MARVKSPLMSMSAQKQLGHALIFKMKENKAFVTGYGRPGSKNLFEPSASQVSNRVFYSEVVKVWQSLSQAQKDFWNDLAKNRNLVMSGWNLYYKEAFNDPVGIMGYAYYGERVYGYYGYGYEPQI